MRDHSNPRLSNCSNASLFYCGMVKHVWMGPIDEDGRGRAPSICVGTIHHVRTYMDGELMIDRFLDALEEQEDHPDSILICDTRPDLPRPRSRETGSIGNRIRVIDRPMRTLQEGYNFYPRARNEVLGACGEDVIIWADADERLDPDVVRRTREIFGDGNTAAGVLCLRPMDGYWEISQELEITARVGHPTARLRIFRTEMLKNLGGFQDDKPEWGALASIYYPMAAEGKIRISHEKLYATHDHRADILHIHKLRLLSHQQTTSRRTQVARAVVVTYAAPILISMVIGRPLLALLFLLLPPAAIYLLKLVKSLLVLEKLDAAGIRHSPGAALIGLMHTVIEVLSRALPKA